MFHPDLFWFAAALHFAIALPICGHILLTKEQEAVAVGWMGLVLISPFVGSLIYWLFGINRVMRKARRIRGRKPRFVPRLKGHALSAAGMPTAQQQQLFQFGQSVHEAEFLTDNHLVPLINGDAAYPDMWAAMDRANVSIALSVYIFEYDDVGRQFSAALINAHRRGVKVYVLLDEIGSGYKFRPPEQDLLEAGVKAARFIPQSLKFFRFLNLRNHRKILIIDGAVGYIGGMNVQVGHMLRRRPAAPVQDIHFRVTGPILDQMNAVFEQDWGFATGEKIALPPYRKAPDGETQRGFARLVDAGPDDTFPRLQWIILGALNVAQKSVRIITPYFLPNDVLVGALSVAALRGVDVEVIVPLRTDSRLLDWAMAAKFRQLLEFGIKIHTTAPPFDHSKIMIVDSVWSFIGSTNWDQRSFRLNFEANVECYDPEFAAELEKYYALRKAVAKQVSLSILDARKLPIKLRDSCARLLVPYM